MFEALCKGENEYNKPFLVIDNTKNIQTKQPVKKVNSIKPKGDIELKNIQFRPYDKRYIGRKQINNQIITVYDDTQLGCLKKLKKEIKKATSNKIIMFKDKKYSFNNLFMQWYKQEKEPFIKPQTKNDIMLSYKQLENLHEKDIRKITRQDILDILNKMPNNRTKEKTKLYLNACLKFYFTEGIINKNVCATIKVLKSNSKKSAFSFEQQKAILEKIDKMRIKPIILIYLITGLRKEEFNFKSIEKDIDFNNRLLKAINLKGRNFEKRYKYIQLSQKAIKLIMDNVDIIHTYTAEKTYREFSEILKEININGSLVNLRHTFATNCFYLGKQDLIISKEMGHSRTQITKDVYTDIDYHLSKEKIYKLYNNLYNEN